MTLLTHHPFKALYLLTSLAVNLSRLPFWILKYTFTRQHPSWTFRQALGLRLARAYIHAVSTVQVRVPLRLTPGAEGARFTVITPRGSHAAKFQGPMAANADVKPAEIGGTWYPSARPAGGEREREGELVVLHLHGGAYVLGTGRDTASGAYLATQLLAHTPATRVLVPQYRLSRLPPSPTSNAFPAALQDALTAYLHLVHDLRIAPRDIVLSGDSAGANCAIALLRYIAEYGAAAGVPAPGAALLWSPWIDPTDPSPAYARTNPHYESDYLAPAFLSWGVHALAGETPPLRGRSRLAANPYVNAGLEVFRTPVPMFVNVGGAEVLFFEGRDWAERMSKEGNEVVWDVQEGAVHDIFLMAKMVGMEDKAAEMGKRCGEWLRGVRKGEDG